MRIKRLFSPSIPPEHQLIISLSRTDFRSDKTSFTRPEQIDLTKPEQIVLTRADLFYTSFTPACFTGRFKTVGVKILCCPSDCSSDVILPDHSFTQCPTEVFHSVHFSSHRQDQVQMPISVVNLNHLSRQINHLLCSLVCPTGPVRMGKDCSPTAKLLFESCRKDALRDQFINSILLV